jgi:hypothetical protein
MTNCVHTSLDNLNPRNSKNHFWNSYCMFLDCMTMFCGLIKPHLAKHDASFIKSFKECMGWFDDKMKKCFAPFVTIIKLL